MKVVTYSDLKKNVANVLDSIIDDHSPVLVTRKNNQTTVLIRLNDFNGTSTYKSYECEKIA